MAFDRDPPDDPSRLLARFVDNLPGLAYRCDPEPPWEMTFLRGRVEHLTGYPSSAFEDGAVAYGDIVLEADSDDLERAVRDGVESHSQFSATYRIRTRDGEVKHVFERGVPVVTDGTVTALEGIIIDVSQRKAYERELERQNDLFEHTQQMAAVGGWEYDIRTDELRWSDQVNRIHGLPLSAAPTVEEAIEFYHPDDRPVIEAAVEAALADGEPFDQELRIRTANGETRWVRAKGVPTVEDGEVVRLRGAMQDVTDRREREQSLRAEQALTSSIFEALPDLLYAFDADGTFQRWNDEFRRATGYDDEAVAEMEPTDFIAEADRDRVRTNIGRVLQEGEPITVEARLLTSDGDRIPYEFTGAPLRDEDGSIAGLVGIGRDITTRKERQRRFEAVFNNTYQFTGLLTPDGTLLEANDAGLAFAAADRQDIVGRKLWDGLAFCEEETRSTVRHAVEQARSGEFVREEIRLQRGDTDAVIDFSIRPITDDDGAVSLLVPEGRDITGLKNRERLLRVLHRLLRHNIRNDLTTISGYTDTLSEAIDDEERQQYVDSIGAAAEDLLTSTETAKQMVDLVLDHTGETGRVDLGPVVEQTAQRMRERYPGASIEVTVRDPVVATCDQKVGAVFEQLVENGVEHNPASSPQVQVRVFRRDGHACVEVADDGPGIGDDEWTMVEAEMGDETTQLQHGSGMGLLLARWAVEEFGGSLRYADDESGTVVTVELPAAEA